MLRRGYNFTDGTTRSAGSTPACSSSPTSATRIALHPDADQPRRPDALNEYIQHTGSALFAVPPGVREDDPDDYIGADLFRATGGTPS